ncbi:phosphodiesterase 1A, calmodulin-dependent, partial [Cichlidogyrus casuarinus]
MDELPGTDAEMVPSEVRNWLATTFSRASQQITVRREKPKFRSVANAIRAGLLVEKMYKRTTASILTALSQDVIDYLKAEANNWSFSVFRLHELSGEHSLRAMGYYLINEYDLYNKFKLKSSALDHFLMQLESGYSKYHNPYHNLIHGADVAQTCHAIMQSSKLA